MTVYQSDLPRAYQRRYPATRPLTAAITNGSVCQHEALTADIAQTLHLWPWEIDIASAAGIALTLAGLRRGLRAQRRHARSAHWAYDLAAHARLLELHRILIERCPN